MRWFVLEVRQSRPVWRRTKYSHKRKIPGPPPTGTKAPTQVRNNLPNNPPTHRPTHPSSKLFNHRHVLQQSNKIYNSKHMPLVRTRDGIPRIITGPPPTGTQPLTQVRNDPRPGSPPTGATALTQVRNDPSTHSTTHPPNDQPVHSPKQPTHHAIQQSSSTYSSIQMRLVHSRDGTSTIL